MTISLGTLKLIGLLVLIILSIALSVSAKTIYVTTTGNDNSTGQSWQEAKATVTAGLSAAEAGDQVWVAAGIYVERVILKQGVALYGGFAGNETEFSQRDYAANVTILERYGVTSPEGADNTTRIDGFTIRNSDGIGISCRESSPTISNNTISGNGWRSYLGGGIYCYKSSAVLTNNIINDNNANYGGGILCEFSSATITKNIINGNNATGMVFRYEPESGQETPISDRKGGGGICCVHCSSTIIANNIICGNTSQAGWGGGIFCEDSSVTISNNTITGNRCNYNTGGIRIYASSASVINNIIAFNSSGIHAGSTSTCTLMNNCIYNPDSFNYKGLSAGVGDINVDPKLEAVAFKKLHLLPDSPCINAGIDNYTQAASLDMDNRTRLTGPHVDIGADEYDGTIYESNPVIIRVSPSGNNVNDGSTWTLAKRTVQAAIGAIGAEGGEVWVAKGIYNEHIVLKSYVYIYGGFAGSEKSLSQRDWKMHETILDGKGLHNTVVTTVPSLPIINRNLTMRGYDVGRVDGFTILNDGAAISCQASSFTIANNTIVGDSNINVLAGIHMRSSSVKITNNIISRFGSESGGGVYCSDGSWSLIANNTIFVDNDYNDTGIYYFSGAPTIINNTICGTGARYGRGIYCPNSSALIANNIIAFNHTGIDGSTQYLYNNCLYNQNGDNATILTGTGNIIADPLFLDTANADFHLSNESPCINQGNDAYTSPEWKDIDGQPRIHGPHVDIGADEWKKLKSHK